MKFNEVLKFENACRLLSFHIIKMYEKKGFDEKSVYVHHHIVQPGYLDNKRCYDYRKLKLSIIISEKHINNKNGDLGFCIIKFKEKNRKKIKFIGSITKNHLSFWNKEKSFENNLKIKFAALTCLTCEKLIEQEE